MTKRPVSTASADYRRLLDAHGIECSMSRRGNCWDNAVVESFFATLKTELIHRADYQSPADARDAIFEFIELFYNRQRRHSTLGYQTPAGFERMARAAQPTCPPNPGKAKLIERILTHLAARNTECIDRTRAPPLHPPLTQPPACPSPALS